MGEIREEVQSFYMRDYVEEKVVIIVIAPPSPTNGVHCIPPNPHRHHMVTPWLPLLFALEISSKLCHLIKEVSDSGI